MSSWKDHEIRRKSYLNIACVAGAWKKWAQERTERARETRGRRGSACLRGLSRAGSLSPNTCKPLLHKLPQQNSLCELRATVKVIWAGIPGPGRPGRDTQNTQSCASENRFDGSSPLYSLYSTWMCRWTGYGF